jgi:hypothetical protein
VVFNKQKLDCAERKKLIINKYIVDNADMKETILNKEIGLCRLEGSSS